MPYYDYASDFYFRERRYLLIDYRAFQTFRMQHRLNVSICDGVVRVLFGRAQARPVLPASSLLISITTAEDCTEIETTIDGFRDVLNANGVDNIFAPPKDFNMIRENFFIKDYMRSVYGEGDELSLILVEPINSIGMLMIRGLEAIRFTLPDNPPQNQTETITFSDLLKAFEGETT